MDTTAEHQAGTATASGTAPSDSQFEARRAIVPLLGQLAPDESEQRLLLSLVSQWQSSDGQPHDRRADYHLKLAEAQTKLGDNQAAAANYQAALNFEENLPLAHIGLANLRMPGDDYLTWLDRFYSSLKPRSVIEIGVFEGASLALVRPPTIAIGVDPSPIVASPLRTETHIFAETSDEFFERRRLDALLGGRPLSIAFIDGLHLFEQALRDFVNLEKYCGLESMILFHDTVPLNEATQTRTCNTTFHTGDVWKTVLTIKYYRPDLDVFTIATPWTGLTVVTGFEPAARLLEGSYDEAISRFMDTPFSTIENSLDTSLNIVPNDWEIVQARLRERRIL